MLRRLLKKYFQLGLLSNNLTYVVVTFVSQLRIYSIHFDVRLLNLHEIPCCGVSANNALMACRHSRYT
jgi:hypothetical protein